MTLNLALQFLSCGDRIAVGTLLAHETRVAFEVEDDGSGIPALPQERTFAPFFTQVEGGTGLGQALVQQIAQAYQESALVESDAGRGAKSRVELTAFWIRR